MQRKRSYKINDNTTKIIGYIIIVTVILVIGYFISQSKLFKGLGSAAEGVGDAIGAVGEGVANVVSGKIFEPKNSEFCCANYSARAFICSHEFDDIPVIACNNNDTCHRGVNRPIDQLPIHKGKFNCISPLGKDKVKKVTLKEPVNTFNGKLIGYNQNLTPIFKK